jgi:hypothetical protein
MSVTFPWPAGRYLVIGEEIIDSPPLPQVVSWSPTVPGVGAEVGRKYRFFCESCGYEAQVSGGPDRGWFAAAHTVSCPRCRELSDAELCNAFHDISAFDLLRLSGHDLALWMQSQKKTRCGLDGRHAASLWSHPGPCPRCGTTLRREGPVAMWD